MKSDQLHCDIFCRVVDNYGDAAVCWRLARQLAVEHDWHVRLWIDDPAPLRKLAPISSPVEVRPWDNEIDDPADIVIEAFACEPPAAYIAAMAKEKHAPVWLNLEYLSAETWVASCHGLPSPHPRLRLTKHFFFPGFTAGTGSLLRERDYTARRTVFNETAFREEFGLPGRQTDELVVSLFSYSNPALPALQEVWSQSPTPISLLVPGGTEPASQTGNLRQYPLPFLPQIRYDELLWACDLNFVRGEDSFVRAQWAAKPFVWHIYPQAEGAHFIKLDAFLARYAKVGAGGTALRHFWHTWNGDGTLDWPEFATALPALTRNAQTWTKELASHPDLATSLVQFCLERLK